MVSIKASCYTSDRAHVTLLESVPEKDLEGLTFDEVHRMVLDRASSSEEYGESKLALIKQHSEEYQDGIYSLQNDAGYVELSDHITQYLRKCECIGECDEDKELRYSLLGPLD